MDTEEKAENQDKKEEAQIEKESSDGEISTRFRNNDHDSDDDSIVPPHSSTSSNLSRSNGSVLHSNTAQDGKNESGNGSNPSNISEKTKTVKDGNNNELNQQIKRKGRRKSIELFYEVKARFEIDLSYSY